MKPKIKNRLNIWQRLDRAELESASSVQGDITF